jgi:hypothetical protein
MRKMDNHEVTKEISSVSSRDQMIRYLDGYAAERKEELDERKLKRALVKSYLIEHTGDGDKTKPVMAIMEDARVDLEPIDENVYRIRTQGRYIGFFEVFTPRYFVIYSLLDSQELERWVRRLILNCPELDHVWLSGLTFSVLWHKVVQLNKPNRYAKIVFEHNSIYQVDSDGYEIEEDEEEEEDEALSPIDESDVIRVVERRASKFSLVDRISVVQEKLTELQKLYSPLYAIRQLRFPSPVGPGGHDFYDNGKVTNRTGSFRDHRNHLMYVQRIYDKLIEFTENKAWYSMHKETVATPGLFQKLVGSPVIISFEVPLSNETFDYWIKSTFGRLRNRFRLWGNPIRLGPRKVHVYGLDKHLWQPIFLEITDSHLIAIIPKGTCGNTVHRLVTNIQRYIDPGAKVYIGDIEYKDMVEQSSQGVKYESKD